MDKKTVIQINIEVPHMVDSVLEESKKLFDGGMELFRYGLRLVNNKENAKKPAKTLNKIEIK
ncbi:hypothetical protein [Ferroplasma sp.]|uniref:hypothetical protein n=1 Tax=Ferroplasma sp. TaxID=2591003 RepID=UPI00307D3BAE